MKSAKIHILDELEEIRLECQKKSSPYSIFVPENEIVHRKKIKNISKQLTIQTDENSQQFDRYIELNRQKSSESPDNRHTKEFSLHEFCETYISTLLNEEYVKKVVCKILGISYHHLLIQNISSILRDPHCSSTIIADIFDPNHIKLSNPERLYSSLESQFGAVKTTMLSLDKNPSRVLSLIKLRGPDNKRLPPGMVILLHPATTTYHEKYQFKLRYRSAITKQTCIESIIFWGNGNLYSNHMTTVHNLPSCYTAEESDDHKANDRRLSMIPLGGDQQEHLKNSLPGYNGRIPIWIPSLEVEITLEEKMMCHGIPETDEDEDFCPPLTPIQKTDRNDNEQDRVLSAESFDYSIERQKAKDKNLMRLNFSHSYNSLLDEHVKSLIKQPSMTSTSRSHFDHGNTSLLFSTPYVNPVATSPTLSYHLGSPNGARRNIYLSSPNSQQIVIHLKYFACQSLEATLHQLAAITARCQRQAIASLTLPGNVPALNNACLYGNIHAVRKFLEYGADPNRICGSTYSTPLHDAVLGGNCEIIKLLLSKGALQVLVDENRWTPLHLACWKDDLNSIRALLVDKKHACEAVRMKDRHGQTPNHLCKRRIIKDVVEKFMTDHKIPIKKASWWNTLSNSFRGRVDGKERDHRDAIKQYVIKARMKGQSPKDSDYY